MSKQSEKVKKWRKATKARIVEAMGGKCVICGYVKCNDALSLHHLDPSKKDFGFGGIRANPKKWDDLVNELRKCILVCANCHFEIHAGVLEIPDDVSSFNEDFSSYRMVKSSFEKLLSSCPICNNLKPEYLKYCSRKCSSESKFKVDWNNIDLFEELKTKSIVKLAEELGCSDGAIHKRMKKIGLK